VALHRRIRSSGELTLRRSAVLGVGYGVALGLLFLLYSGWFVWFAPGVLVAFALVMPWRTALAKASTLLGTAAVVFVGASSIHLRGLFASKGGFSAGSFYFDTCPDPTYIAMWADAWPLLIGPVFPPFGELGGVGVFTLLLAAGALLAIALGWRK